MAFNDSEFQYIPEHLFVDNAGKVYLNIDNDDGDISDWATRIVEAGFGDIVSINIDLDLPMLTESIIDQYQRSDYPDKIAFSESSRSVHTTLRQQYLKALELLDKVEFVPD